MTEVTVAYYELTGPRNESILASVRNKFSNFTVHTPNIIARARLDLAHARVEILGDSDFPFSRQDLERFDPKGNWAQDGKFDVRMTYDGFPQAENQANTPSEGRREIIKMLEAKVGMLYAASHETESLLVETAERLSQAQADSEHFMARTLDMEEQIANAERENIGRKQHTYQLEQRVAEQAEKIQTLQERVRTYSALTEVVESFLEEVAGPLEDIKKTVTNEVYDPSQTSLPEIIQMAVELEGDSTEFNEGVMIGFIEDFGDEEHGIQRIYQRFADLNPGLKEKYDAAKQNKEGMDKVIALLDKQLEGKQITKMAHDQMIKHAAATVSNENDAILEYESQADQYCQRFQEIIDKLMQFKNMQARRTELKELILERIPGGAIPIAVHLYTDVVNYVIDVVLPEKSKQDSLFSIVAAELLMSKQVRDEIGPNDFQALDDDISIMEGSGLVRYRIELPCTDYSFEHMQNISATIQGAVRKGYNASALGQAGIGVDVIYLDQLVLSYPQAIESTFAGHLVHLSLDKKDRESTIYATFETIRDAGSPIARGSIESRLAARGQSNEYQFRKNILYLEAAGMVDRQGELAATKYFPTSRLNPAEFTVSPEEPDYALQLLDYVVGCAERGLKKSQIIEQMRFVAGKDFEFDWRAVITKARDVTIRQEGFKGAARYFAIPCQEKG